MEISNSSPNYAIKGPNSAGTSVQKPAVNQQDIARVQFEKDKEPQEKQKSRLDIDQQAIELVEQQSQGQVTKQPQQATKNTGYDQPSEQNYTAVAAYQSIENLSQRDNIQQVFGVDLLA